LLHEEQTLNNAKSLIYRAGTRRIIIIIIIIIIMAKERKAENFRGEKDEKRHNKKRGKKE
jgi:hypothetical protein